MDRISNDTDLFSLEQSIGNELKKCGIWSDLRLSEEEYRILKTIIRGKVSDNPDTRGYMKVFNAFPKCCVAEMVFFIVFDYRDEFWSVWAEQMGISVEPNQQRTIGQKMLQTTDENGFTYDNDGYTYVTPLICQAGVPRIYFCDLFEVLDDDTQQVFDPNSVINELQGWKSYLIHKPVERFMKNHREKAISLLADIKEMMHTATSLNASAQATISDAHLLNIFNEWRTNKVISGRRRGSAQTDYPFPTLSFSDDGKGICLRLPSIISRNEYSDEITWVIMPEGYDEIEIVQKYFKDADKLFTKESQISIVPAAHYQIKLFDDIDIKTPLKEQRIEGIGDAAYLLFDYQGRRIFDGFIPNEQGYLIAVNKNIKISFEHINYTPVDLPRHARTCSAWYIAPESSDARIIITDRNEDIVLRTHYSLNAALCEAEYLFGEKPVNGILPIYTDFPRLSINLDEGGKIGDFSIFIRHRQTGMKREIDASEDSLASGLIDLTDNAQEGSPHFGLYDIRIQENSTVRKILSFAFVPKIRFMDDDLNPWPSRYSNVARTGFRYVNPDNADIEIQSDANVISEIRKNTTWNHVSVDTPNSTVTGIITYDCGGISSSIKWNKKVRYFSWSVWNEAALEPEDCYETRIFEDSELKDARFWLSLWLQQSELANNPVLELRNKDGNVLQQMEVIVGKNGKWNIPFDGFATTLENNKLPVDFVLSLMTHDETLHVTLARLTETVILPQLKYQNDEKTRNRPTLLWSADSKVPEVPVILRGITEPDYEQKITFDTIIMTKDQSKRALFLSEALRPGLYRLEPVIEDDFFYEEAVYRPPLLQEKNMLFVNIVELGRACDTLTSLLKLVIAHYNKPQTLQQILDKVSGRSKPLKVVADDTMCKLLILLVVNFAEADDDSSKIIMQLLDYINAELLNDNHRALLSKMLLRFSLTEAQMKLCLRKLHLFLFSVEPGLQMTPEEIRRMGELNPELELLWMLRTEQRRGLMQKLISIVGIDALKDMLVFTPVNTCGETDWYNCLSKTINNKCSCAEFMISRGICGNSEDFNNMFEWGVGYATPKLVLAKRPESGKYFCGQTYVDLLITWYLRNKTGNANRSDDAKPLAYLYPQLDDLKRRLSDVKKEIANDCLKNIAGRDRKERVSFYPLFYYSAISSLASSFISHGLISEEDYLPAQRFLVGIMDIFPELVVRDLLMCELLMFFGREV